MLLNYITLSVRNIEKSIEFHTELVGLKVVRTIEPPMGKIVFMQNSDGETMLELVRLELFEKVSAKGLVFSFSAIEKLSAIRERAMEMGYQPSEIVSQRPKPDYFTVIDPDGLTIEFS